MSFTHWLSERLGRPYRTGGVAPRPVSKRKALARRRTFRPRLEFLEDRLTPSTLTVTTALDEFDGGTAANAAGPDGRMSLREAISAASSGDQIVFDRSLSGSTINLDPARGELLIYKNLDILGLGAANLAVSGQNSIRVFEITAGATDSISGLTIENGFADSSHVPFYSSHGGGGIFNAGTLTVSDSTLSGNSTIGDYYYGTGGGGIFNAGSLSVSNSSISDNSARVGGGIYNSSALNVTDSMFCGNQASFGGGIYNGNYYVGPATATVSGSTVSGNFAGAFAGGIMNEARSFLIVSGGSTLSANVAGDGGGIGNYGTLTVRDSTLFDNSAVGYSSSDGGAIYTAFGAATITGSSLSDNSSPDSGGAIFNLSEPLTVSSSTLSGNSATNGGGIYNTGILIVTDASTLSNNTASVDGGGIYTTIYSIGSTTVSGGSTLSGNSAGHEGGGIYTGNFYYLYYGETLLTVSGSTLSGNSAGYEGGGVYAQNTTATVSGSTLTGNMASLSGGGIYNANGTVTVSNSSTIAGNSAGYEGGGIYNFGARYSADGMLNVTDSIVCGNYAPVGADIYNLGTLTLTNSDVCDIARASSTTTVYSSDFSSSSSSVFGQVVTISAYVTSTGGATPTGTMTFLLDGSTTLGTATLIYGQATITVVGLSVGNHTITATYSGDTNSTGSTSAVFTQTVLSSQQELGVIINQVTNLVTYGVLSSQNGNALIVKLNNALSSLNKGNTIAGVNQLDAFISQTDALLKSGKLDSTDTLTLITDIDETIAAALASPF